MHSPPRQAYRMPINPQLGQMIQNPRQTMLQTGTQYPTNYNINQAQPNPVIPQLRHITPARQRNSSPIHLHSHTTMQTQNAMTDFYNNQTAVNDRIIKPLFRNQVTINNGMPPLPLQMPKQIPTYAYSGDLNQLPWNIAHNIEQELEQGHHTQ